MALTCSKATLLHAALAAISPEVATVDYIIRSPARLPPELLVIIRTHLLAAITTQLFLDSTRALTEYEAALQRLLCPDCISYNQDIFGPDVWQWQQFSGPCACVQTTYTRPSKLTSILDPQQFVNPHHWLEHHLSLRVKALHPSAAHSSQSTIWDVVLNVLHRYHCEPIRDRFDDFRALERSVISRNGVYTFSHRRFIDFHSPFRRVQPPPTIRIRPLQHALRLYENRGIGESGEVGDIWRAGVILHQTSRELGLTIELQDVFRSPRDLPPLLPSWSPHRQGACTEASRFDSNTLYASPILHGVTQTYSFMSAVLGAFVSMPMAIATMALTIICFYSRPVALRVGV